jgi:hypothetical protein
MKASLPLYFTGLGSGMSGSRAQLSEAGVYSQLSDDEPCSKTPFWGPHFLYVCPEPVLTSDHFTCFGIEWRNKGAFRTKMKSLPPTGAKTMQLLLWPGLSLRRRQPALMLRVSTTWSILPTPGGLRENSSLCLGVLSFYVYP